MLRDIVAIVIVIWMIMEGICFTGDILKILFCILLCMVCPPAFVLAVLLGLFRDSWWIVMIIMILFL